MARRLRIPFPDARYHVINRGNCAWASRVPSVPTCTPRLQGWQAATSNSRIDPIGLLDPVGLPASSMSRPNLLNAEGAENAKKGRKTSNSPRSSRPPRLTDWRIGRLWCAHQYFLFCRDVEGQPRRHRQRGQRNVQREAHEARARRLTPLASDPVRMVT